MREIFIVIALFLFSNGLNAQISGGDSWAAAKERKSGKITALFLQEDAFAFIDAAGKPAGIEIDIFNQFVTWVKNAKGVTLEVNYVPEPNFQKFYTSVQNGPNGLIGLGTITILERRKSEVQFSPAFINNVAVLVSHQSAPDLDKLENISTAFAGRKLVVAKGTTLEGYSMDIKNKHFRDVKVEYVSSQMEVVKKVAEDPSAFAYMDISIFWPAYDKEKLPVKRHPVGDLSSETFGFIMPLKSDWSPVLTEFFNLGSGYRANPAYKAILMKHLGGEVTKMLQLAQNRQVAADNR